MYVIHYNNIILILILYQQLDFSHVYIFNFNKNDVGIEKLLLDKKVYKCFYYTKKKTLMVKYRLIFYPSL